MTNAESLKEIVTALGGTPSGATNAELIQEIADLLGSEASASSNSEALSNLAGAATGKIFGTGQTKPATPATSKVTVEPDAGKVLTKVEVSAVTAAIDANIVAGNIKKDITILGVEGTYEGSGGSWALWDGTTTIADADGNALYDVYFVLPIAGSSPASTVSGMIPKGEELIKEDYITLVAGGFTADGICASEAYIGDGDDASGYTTAVVVGGTPPAAGAATGTEFTPAVGTNVFVYIRDSNGLPNA